jgi:zinc protease
LAVWAALLLAVAGCTAPAAPGVPPAVAAKAETASPRYDYRETKMANGLRVITLENQACPIVAVQLWYHVGSKNDQPDRTGFAHMFEHMMFRGTARLGSTDHFDYIRRTGGSCNAFTSNDVTVYHEVLPANQLELALWLESERLAFLKVDRESFQTERKVVEEERRMGRNRPYGTLQDKLLAEVFHVSPYRWPVIGDAAQLRAATVPELRAFWQRYYTPNNCTLVVVGAVTHDQVRQLAGKYFAWIPRGADLPTITVREPMPQERRVVMIQEENAPAPLVGIGYRTVPTTHPDTPALGLLDDILSGGHSSRLYRDLVVQRQLAVHVDSFDEGLEMEGVFGVGAAMIPVVGDPQKVLAAIEEHIARVRQEPVSEKELLKARNRALLAQVTGSLRTSSKAFALGEAAVLEGDTARVNQKLDKIRAVTAADILRVARTYLVPEKALVVLVPMHLPEAAKSAKADSPDAATPAATEAAPAVPAKEAAAVEDSPGGRAIVRPKDLPEAPPVAGLLKGRPKRPHTSATLPNGLQVIVVPDRSLPYVTVDLRLLAGAWTEAKPGAASMTMNLLTRGTARHTEAELAEELDTYAIHLNGEAGSDGAALSASCLSEHLPRAMGLLAETALTPSFPQKEFERRCRQLHSDLSISMTTPSYLANREFQRQVYGTHPYSRTSTGEPADIDRLTVGDLRQWYRQFARPDMAVLIFAGDVEPEAALKLARQAFGQWPAEGPKPKVTLPEFPAPSPTHIVLVDCPGTAQSEIRIGQSLPSFTRHDPGYGAAEVVNGYFGGSFSSWLNEAVRVKRGLTYSVSGGFGDGRFGGQFSVRTFSKSESAAEAVTAILEEIARLRTAAPTAAELAKTQTHFLGAFAGDHETAQQVAGDFWLIASQGLPDNYIDALLDGISRVDAGGCLAVADKLVDPAKLTVVVAGDAAKMKAALEKIAPVTVVKPGGGQASAVGEK